MLEMLSVFFPTMYVSGPPLGGVSSWQEDLELPALPLQVPAKRHDNSSRYTASTAPLRLSPVQMSAFCRQIRKALSAELLPTRKRAVVTFLCLGGQSPMSLHRRL